MLDWSIFWNAFGAIGTTIGSLITAVAVVIAVRQYKQPLIKKLCIKMTSAFPVGLGIDIDMICIEVANTGIRPISITNIYFNVGSKNLILNAAQMIIPGALQPVSFPVYLQQEENVTMYLNRENLKLFFTDAVNKGEFSKHTKVKILVTDKTNGSHKKSTGLTISDFLR